MEDLRHAKARRRSEERMRTQKITSNSIKIKQKKKDHDKEREWISRNDSNFESIN